jgi:hypothetical protein
MEAGGGLDALLFSASVREVVPLSLMLFAYERVEARCERKAANSEYSTL